MKTSFIASNSISSASRLSIMKLQAKLVEAQKEVGTGRHADVGLALGYQTGNSVSLRQELTRLQTITQTNSLVKTRLDVSQAALQDISDNAQDFLKQLVAARDGTSGPAIVAVQAKSHLSTLTDSLNTTVNGAFLFAGINADVKPLGGYFQDPPSSAQDAVAAAFQTAFGMSQSDPAVADIPAADMQAFLDGPFAQLFDEAGWTADWSDASDQNVRSRISSSEMIDSSTNANEGPFRALASAFTMVADLNVEGLDDATYKAVIGKAVQLVGDAIQGVTTLQANLGTAQERVTNANDRMSIQTDVITSHIGALEGVDVTEASTRVAQLLTQIETAYAMTARVQQLSLLNYLPLK